MEPFDRSVPSIAVDEIVPVGDQVAERAALVTEQDTAVHAPRALVAQLGRRVRQIHLAPVVDPLLDGARRMLLPLDLDEPCDLAHVCVAGSASRNPAY